jgi:hypothetical protein
MFEIHATVETDDVEKFKNDCCEFGCKPILIELISEDYVCNQLMTSQKFLHDDWEKEVLLIKEKLISKKYNILRIKVEEFPVPGNEYKYLETHVRIKTNKEKEIFLDSISNKYNFHKSRNIFKKINESEFYMMCTYRVKESNLSAFKNKISDFTNALSNLGFYYDKLELEGCLMDTNENLDNKWLN